MKPIFLSFSIPSIANLPAPGTGRTTYQDAKQPALSLYVTRTGVKTFFVRKRVKGRDERLVIGRFPEVSVEQARKQAAVFCGIIAERKDPLQEARKDRQDRLTFGEHFGDYMERYSKLHKKTWKRDVEEVNRHLSDWFNKRLSDIRKDDVARRHEKLGRCNGKAVANHILRKVSSIFNKAIEWGWQGTNPAKGVKQFREKSRDRFVQPHEMPHLLKALSEEENETARDLIHMLLLTGARKTNMLMMRWEQVSFERQEWRIPETKNGEPLVLPLVEAAMAILLRRKEVSRSQWVFAQEQNPGKRLQDPAKAWGRIKAEATLALWRTEPQIADWLEEQIPKLLWLLSVGKKVKRLVAAAEKQNFSLPLGLIDIRLHDIRRTFGSYQALTGASLPVIGKSLGHKSSQSTQIYARLNLEPVRAAMEKGIHAMTSL